ncbi:MAG TPA: NAD(P)-binding domain-containing protein [Gemmatimonadales bacterium]
MTHFSNAAAATHHATDSETLDCIVIGAGQAGLAAGHHLARRGLSFEILEASAAVGGSWPSYYDSLTLFSPARYSSLPGLRFPGDPDRYPTRDEVVAYLRDYARTVGLPVRTGARVTRIDEPSTDAPPPDETSQAAGLFRVETDDGRVRWSRSVVVATGSFHRPHVPDIPGRESFGGTVLHSSAYRNPAPFVGQRMIVVGAGNSAVQIAAELAGVADVRLATRAPVRFVPQRFAGRDIHFWFRVLGVDSFPSGRWREGEPAAAVLDTGRYAAALAAGRPARMPMFTAFAPGGVVGADGAHVAAESVIFATGFRPSVEFLRGTAAVDETGRPLQRLGVSTTVRGLYYVGLSGQRSLTSATLRRAGPDAAAVVRDLARHVRLRR